MLNEAWIWRPLGDLFEIGAGKTMSRDAREGANQTPFLRTSNVLWDEIDLSSVDEMAIPARELPDKLLHPGDLLVCEGGEIGRAAVWNGRIPIMAFQNHLHRLRAIADDVEPRFYVYFLQCAFTQLGLFEGAGNKTTIPNISRNTLAGLAVPQPPLDEQRAIRAVLGRVREAIATHRRSTLLAEELKRAAMHELFTRGLRGEAQKETEIGPMPRSWKPRKLRDLCGVWSGGTPPKSASEYWSGNIPWVSGKDLKVPVLSDATDHVNAAGVQAGSRLAPTGAVLLLVRGMGLAKDLPVSVITRPMAFNQDIKALVSHGEFSGAFVRSAIYAARQRLLARVVPSAHGTMTLNLDDVQTLELACPPEGLEAEDITSILDAVDRKISLHEAKKAALDELFKALLHKLMTGEIRVADLDLAALAPKPAAEATA